MAPTDLTVEILKGIRDEVKSVRDEVQGVRDDVKGIRDEVRETNMRLDRLERRRTEAEVRLGTQLSAVAGAVHEVCDLLREDRELRRKVDNHEQRIGALERRAG